MQKLERIEGVAAPLPIANIDTDTIVPSRFLKTVSRSGLGKALFAELRDDNAFILNREPWNRSEFLVSLDNFGCGSSREHAPWALTDFGIRCIIAPSFAEIFYNNCFKNSLLPIALSTSETEHILSLVSKAETSVLKVDLVSQTLTTSEGESFWFDISPSNRETLLLGLDEVEEVFAYSQLISNFEAEQRSRSPWLFQSTLGPA